jgi:cytochrome c biogenesis protein CcmG, thiol:disulfide interchange protein DsbE
MASEETGVENHQHAVLITPEEADLMVARLISLVLDLLVGFCTLVAVAIVVLIFHRVTPHVLVPVAAAIFFIAAMVRAAWGHLNPWMEGFAISLGAFFPVALAAVAALHGGNLELWEGAVVLALVCGAGAQTQRFWRQGHRLATAGTVVATTAVLLLLGKFGGLGLLAEAGVHPMDRPAPPIAMTLLDGTPVTLDTLKGHVVVLDFWGTWCEPCMAEMPAVASVYHRYRASRDVLFVAVNAGWHDDTADTVRAFVARRHLDLPVALDTGGATAKLRIDGLPTLVVLDPRGHIRVEDVGYDADLPLERELTGQIDALRTTRGAGH